jgi:hypothetical protein
MREGSDEGARMHPLVVAYRLRRKPQGE